MLINGELRSPPSTHMPTGDIRRDALLANLILPGCRMTDDASPWLLVLMVCRAAVQGWCLLSSRQAARLPATPTCPPSRARPSIPTRPGYCPSDLSVMSSHSASSNQDLHDTDGNAAYASDWAASGIR